MNAIDTNVLIYAVDASEPVKSLRADQLLHQLLGGDTPLVIPWQVAVEFLACLRRWEDAGRISRRDTDAYLNRFIAPLPIVFPSTACLRLSLDLSSRHSLSHWDSMLLASCMEAGVDTLYSEDLSSGTVYGTVVVVNPFI